MREIQLAACSKRRACFIAKLVINDLVLQVVAGPHFLEVITQTGLETYTARWGAVSLSAIEAVEGGRQDQV